MGRCTHDYRREEGIVQCSEQSLEGRSICLVQGSCRPNCPERSRLPRKVCAILAPECTDPFRIPKDKARDLGTIKSKLDKGAFSTTEDLDADVHLMVANARTFNGPDSVVTAAADELLKLWQTAAAKALQ